MGGVVAGAGFGLGKSQEEGQQTSGRHHSLVVDSTDGLADFGAGDGLGLVDHDLRFLSEAVGVVGFYIDPEERGVAQLAGDGEDGHGWMGIEEV